MTYQIQPLEPEQWQGYEIIFRDYADSCYDVSIALEQHSFFVQISKKPLEQRRIIEYSNKLFEAWLTDTKAWGVIENEQLIAVIETSADQSNRLYVAKLWVDENYRRQGIAAALMDVAKQQAKDENRRTVYLETWSCNEHAIGFYISQGFSLIGFDSCPFSNDDIQKYNVPLKLGCFL